MARTTSIMIESLHEGYIVTENGKSKAVDSSSDVMEYLLSRFKKETERFSHYEIKDMVIELKVIENAPKIETN